jgi:hypothetical protein
MRIDERPSLIGMSRAHPTVNPPNVSDLKVAGMAKLALSQVKSDEVV